jgi:hypothetical protein
MAIYGAFDQNFFLTQGIARAMGVSLTEALADGRLDREGYAAMVAQCHACPHAADCKASFADARFTLRGAPSYCRNRPALNEIALRG